MRRTARMSDTIKKTHTYGKQRKKQKKYEEIMAKNFKFNKTLI